MIMIMIIIIIKVQLVMMNRSGSVFMMGDIN
jgi:hypothetical protein